MDEPANTLPVEDARAEIDRSPPIGMFLSGESFFKAAQHLHHAYEAGELRLSFDMPVYYLYCHAFELILKAFLRAKGVSAHRLASREFGHKLQVLWDACVAEGLQSNPFADGFIGQTIELLDPFARNFEFRYLKLGFKQLPTLTDVRSAVADLIAAVKPHCLATLSEPIPDRG
jgi:hypothetical protein